MNIQRRHFVAAAATFMMLGPVGCASLSSKDKSKKPSLLDRMPWSSSSSEDDETESEYPDPQKLAATWTPDTLVQMGRTPTRGFGGRIFFYDEKSRPVPVDGTLNVHGFDEMAKTPENAVKKFEFTPEQFTRHFSESDLGASYSIWIPWDAVGSNQKRITLVASFKTKDGRVVQGSPATIVLPGPLDPESNSVTRYSSQFQDHAAAMNPAKTPESGLTTTTIHRRTRTLPAAGKTPNLPKQMQQPATMLADKTPSLEIPMARGRQTPGILPASAQEPLKN